MAEGIVTSSDAEFRAMLAEIPELVAQLAMQARGLIFDVLPQTVDTITIAVAPRTRSRGR